MRTAFHERSRRCFTGNTFAKRLKGRFFPDWSGDLVAGWHGNTGQPRDAYSSALEATDGATSAFSESFMSPSRPGIAANRAQADRRAARRPGSRGTPALAL